MHGPESRFEPLLIKSGITAALTLLMLWPLARVESLVTERQELERSAYQTIASGYGGEQVVGGPVLSIATEDRTVVVDPVTQATHELWKAGAPLRLLAQDVHIQSEVAVTERRKGIYVLPVYVTKLVIAGQFKPDAVDSLRRPAAESRVLPQHCVLQVPLSGVKSLRMVRHFEVGGEERRPFSGEIAGIATVSAALDLGKIDAGTAMAFRVELELAGSESLHFLPLAGRTEVVTQVSWPDPDFDGAFFPVSHEKTAQGFSATWQVLELNRAIPPSWRGNEVSNASLLAASFGFRLFQPANLYAQNYRAVRYGILFIAITFMCFFAFEHLAPGLRLHPMHYLLVGLSLATFYLLLLALSEHVGFATAYAAAAMALVALITVYLAGATRSRSVAAAVGTALAGSYAALYVILLSDDDALLLGALLLFGILGSLMLATRRLNWSAIGRTQRGEGTSASSPEH